MVAGSPGFSASRKKMFLVRAGMMLGLALLITAMFYRLDTVTMPTSAVKLGAALLPLYFVFLGLNAFEDKVLKRTPWWFVVAYKIAKRAIKAVIWMGLGAYFYDLWLMSEELACWQFGIFSVLVVIPKMVEAYLHDAPTPNRRSKPMEEPRFR